MECRATGRVGNLGPLLSVCGPKIPSTVSPLLARFAGAELEFLLDAANRVARITLFHLNDQSRPRLRSHHSISCQALACLKCFDSSFTDRTKYSVDSEIVAARPEQKLKGPYRMSLAAVLYHWPRA